VTRIRELGPVVVGAAVAGEAIWVIPGTLAPSYFEK
jgi:hypothetical protein